jgi:hypothetical protein
MQTTTQTTHEVVTAEPSIEDDAFDDTCAPVPSPGWLNHGDASR